MKKGTRCKELRKWWITVEDMEAGHSIELSRSLAIKGKKGKTWFFISSKVFKRYFCIGIYKDNFKGLAVWYFSSLFNLPGWSKICLVNKNELPIRNTSPSHGFIPCWSSTLWTKPYLNAFVLCPDTWTAWYQWPN